MALEEHFEAKSCHVGRSLHLRDSFYFCLDGRAARRLLSAIGAHPRNQWGCPQDFA